MLREESLGVAGEVEKFDSFPKIGFVGVPVSVDLALAAHLFLAPLVRHFFEECHIHQPIELIDIHGVDTIAQPPSFDLKPPDGSLVFPALVGVAGVQSIAYPFQNLVIEPQPPEQFGELILQHFLAHIFATAIGGLPLAFISVAGAMVINVSLLLDLADNGAAAGAASDEPGESKVPPTLLRTARIAPVHHALHPFP